MAMMTRGDVLALMSLISEAEGLRTPRLSLVSRQGHARSSHISIPRWALQKHEAFALYYICHEMAHLVESKAGRFSSHHGESFKQTEQRICAKFGVKITGYSEIGKGAYPRVDQVI